MIAAREAFQALQLQLEVESVVWIDEAGANLAMTPIYGRSPAGQRLVESRPTKRKGRTSMIAALGVHGVVSYDMVSGSYNEERFLDWLTDHLLPSLKPNTALIWDNVRFHLCTSVRSVVEAAGHRLIKFPPYSPDLTPIEECWSKVKHLIRKAKPRTRQCLWDAFEAAISEVSQSDILGWIAHAGYLTPASST